MLEWQLGARSLKLHLRSGSLSSDLDTDELKIEYVA